MFSIKKDKILLFSIAIFSLLVTLYCQFPLLTNKFAINDDVRQEIYHYERYRDSELFKDDLTITGYLKNWNPEGLDFFYFLISKIYDPVKFTKILPFFLCMLSAVYIFMIGRTLKNEKAGLLAGIIFVFFAWTRKEITVFGTGNGEDFGILFCIMFMHYYLKKDFLKTSIILILLALFYPPLLIICLLTYLFSLILELARGARFKKGKLLILSITLLLILIVLGVKYGGGKIKMLTLQEMKNMEEFYPGGRKRIFYPSFYQRWANIESGMAIDYPVEWLIVISILLFLFYRKKALSNLPLSLWHFIFISFVMFAISNIVMFRLYGPSRYMRYPLPLFLILFVAVNLTDSISKIKSSRLKPVFLAGFIMFTAFYFFPEVKARYRIAPYPRLYGFLQSLPKDILVAGEPFLMDDIPTFAKRMVLVNDEISQPYFADFYPLVKARIFDFFDAYYSDSYEKICDFCKKYKVTHLVVDKRHLSKDYVMNHFVYYKPFEGYIRGLAERRRGFILADIPESKKIFSESNIFVIKAEDICREK